jgi:peptidoglycan/LPS O-acetylase OafA/YrhL
MFYLALPILLKRTSSVPHLCLTIIGLRLLAEPLIVITGLPYSLRLLNWFSRFECMAFGALFAWLVFTHYPILRIIYHRAVEYGALIIFAFVVVVGEAFPLRDWLLSIVFGVVITNLASHPSPTLRLETPLLRRLGEASYGLYMWHRLVILGVITVIGVDGVDVQPIGVYAVVVGCSILTALVSHRFIEMPFLSLKKRFTPTRLSAPTPALTA